MTQHLAQRLEEKIFIPGPAGSLEAMVYGIEAGKIIGVVCHPHPLYQGTMQNKVVTTICKAWQSLGLATVRFNFRGVGDSEGAYDKGNGERLDLEAILNYFQAKYPAAEFFLAGFSFGSYIALQVAAEAKNYPIKALLSVAPPVHHFAFNTTLLPSCPWLIIQGKEDQIVPYEKVLAFANTLQSQKADIELITLEKAEHFFHGQLIELRAIIEKYFSKILDAHHQA